MLVYGCLLCPIAILGNEELRSEHDWAGMPAGSFPGEWWSCQSYFMPFVASRLEYRKVLYVGPASEDSQQVQKVATRRLVGVASHVCISCQFVSMRNPKH